MENFNFRAVILKKKKKKKTEKNIHLCNSLHFPTDPIISKVSVMTVGLNLY